ncbi:MAG TPA: MlaE family lipid ABC transporter permease subunit [Kofleriaceae bacterium]|jgi:phospholipid/cholesterol/gamma-HCH transport system permease protein|nr:MlaE family lipid ABC transporter permease subunit [Kofleriaceae bacterium]
MPGWHIVRGEGRLELAGELGFADAAAIWHAMGDATAGIVRPRDLRGPGDDSPEPALVIDLDRATRVDGAVIALVVAVRARLLARGVRCHITADSERLRALVHLYRGDELPPPVPVQRGRERGIAWLGGAVDHALAQARQMVAFSGELAAAIAETIRRPARASWRDLPALIIRAGTDGIPIILVLNFLIGFVMAYQSARQLALFGANIFAADIVGLSVPRELAPLMTAIIVVGRSGAAYAAELGTMRVSDEIDALRTMGFAPVPYLVVPRILALVIVTPVLTLLGDVVGVIGGIVVGSASLDITPAAFLAELRTAVEASDLWTGLCKSVAFGAAIGVIGCQHGLATRGAASGVGRGTTSTVVSCLFTIVVIDTLFTMVFRRLGL